MAESVSIYWCLIRMAMDVYAKDYVTVEDLNRQFGLKLQRTKIKKIDLGFSKNQSGVDAK